MALVETHHRVVAALDHAMAITDKAASVRGDRLSDEMRLALQREAILREMVEADLTTSHAHDAPASEQRGSRTVVELGAGDGALSRELRRAGAVERCILVDRNLNRLERYKGGPSSDAEQRLCIDVAELQPEALRQAVPQGCIILSNHMCGAALDMGIHCALRAWKDESASSLCGIIVVPCCHHECNWFTYLGREFLEECGLTVADFEIVRKWSRLA